MTREVHGNSAGKRLVVFGCGYVGGEVARQAVARGMRVTALTRNAAKAASLQAAGIETVVADLAGPDWQAKVGNADFVLNAVSSGGGGLDGYRRSYLEGMASVVAWAQAGRALGPIVYTSSTSVYPQDGGASVDETAAVTPRDDRAAVLIETERRLLDGWPSARVLRLAGIYGPARVNLVEQVRMGEVSGRPEPHLNLVHRDDIAAAVWAAWTAPAGGDRVFNVVDDAPTPKGEVVAWLAEKLGVPPPRFTGAPAAGRRTVTPDRIIRNARLKAALGWAPQFPSFRAGYEKLLSR